jgi:tripartite-type tricarboxylate transporter receptor subunit TctC
MRRLNVLSGIAAVTLAAATPVSAQSVADFYRGKSISLEIPTSVGGGYDVHARLLSRHMGRFIPGNPTIVPKNTEGASGLRLANALYNNAPKDGTAFGIFLRSSPFEPQFGNKAAQYDATRFTWIGSPSSEVSICVAWHTTGITSIHDLFTREMLIGSLGPSADTTVYPRVMNGVLGTRVKIIHGYPGGNDIMLAVERGELGGRCAWSWSAAKATRRDWIEQKRVHILVQLGLSKHPDLPDVPLIVDLAKKSEDRDILKLVFARQEIAWPFVAPPDLPKDRAAALRAAFDATMKDKTYRAEADKAKLEIMPVAGADMQRLVGELYATPAPIVQRAMEMLK